MHYKKIKNVSLWLALPIVVGLIGCKQADLQQVASVIKDYQQPLDTRTVVSGLKQALEVGTNNSVQQSSANGGFSDNPLIRIAVPQELNKTAVTLRKYGLGSLVDKFELQMNRSAEKAAEQAGSVFINSISQMTISDAWGILRGQDNAATQYFKRTTESDLRQRFQPIIRQSMGQIGFYDDYRSLLKAYDTLPFTEKPNLDIESYIMQKSLDGLFILVAKEEAKIRHNPAARVTELLQKVFAQS